MGCEALPALSNLACVLSTLSFTVSHRAVIRTPGTSEKLSTNELPRSPVPMTPTRMVSLGWNGISAMLLTPGDCARPREAPSDASPASLSKSRREELSITLLLLCNQPHNRSRPRGHPVAAGIAVASVGAASVRERSSVVLLPESPNHLNDDEPADREDTDRKSTRLNSSHLVISYAVFCLKKKKQITKENIQHYIT